MTDTNADTALGLAEMLAGLRGELRRSQTLAKESNIQFEIQNIDLELKLHVEKVNTGGGKLGVKFWVVEAGVSGEKANTDSRTQTIKLSMKAKDLEDTNQEGKPNNANVNTVGGKLP